MKLHLEKNKQTTIYNSYFTQKDRASSTDALALLSPSRSYCLFWLNEIDYLIPVFQFFLPVRVPVLF